MTKAKIFFKTSLIGGLVVILPVAVLVLVFKWIYNLVTKLIQPLSNLIVAEAHLREIFAHILVLSIIILSCFLLGIFVKTRFGKFMHITLEKRFLNNLPGYSLVKETILQFVGGKQTPFSSVALVELFGSDTLMTAFITDETKEILSVFVPTGPNPTSGNIYHLHAKYVHKIDISIEDAMKSIISCGTGSAKLINSYLNNKK